MYTLSLKYKNGELPKSSFSGLSIRRIFSMYDRFDLGVGKETLYKHFRVENSYENRLIKIVKSESK